ncbi:hypothetical protein MRB53_037330 [Persea americana]|nr:hypothetical protein MRB53_037330 [Persea americana]
MWNNAVEMAARTLRIGLIPGDGIGREVIPAGRRILEALPSSLNLKFSFVDLDAGFDCFKATGTALPDKTVETLKKECGWRTVWRREATPGYSSPIVALRKKLDLYANVRPVKTVATAKSPIDLVIVRENTEDLYVKEEKSYDGTPEQGKVAEAIKRITYRASSRIAAMAGDIALRRQRVRTRASPVCTAHHWSQSLTRATSCHRRMGYSARPAWTYSRKRSTKRRRRSSRWQSRSCAKRHVGDGFAIGEPCHGSAPDIEGKGIANPIATLRSVGCMLDFLNEEEAAAVIYKAVDANLEEGKVLSPDMGGSSSTEEVVEDVLRRL